MEQERYAILEKISAVSVYLPCLLCLYKLKALNKILWALFAYLVLCIFVDYLSWSINENRRNLLMNSFTVAEYILIAFIYFHQFENLKIRSAIQIVSAVFVFLAGIVFVFMKEVNNVDTTIAPISSAIIMIMAGSYFIKLLIDPQISKMHRHFFYWINLGFILYFPIGIILFSNFDFLKVCKPSTLYLIWGIHLVLNTIKNILLGVGIWMKRNTQ